MIPVSSEFSIVFWSHGRVVTLAPLPTIPLFTTASAPQSLLSQDGALVPAGRSEECSPAFLLLHRPVIEKKKKKKNSFCQSTRPTATLRNSVSEQKVWRVHAASARRRSGPEHFHALGGFLFLWLLNSDNLALQSPVGGAKSGLSPGEPEPRVGL